jgi:hypothetical protein
MKPMLKTKGFLQTQEGRLILVRGFRKISRFFFPHTLCTLLLSLFYLCGRNSTVVIFRSLTIYLVAFVVGIMFRAVKGYALGALKPLLSQFIDASSLDGDLVQFGEQKRGVKPFSQHLQRREALHAHSMPYYEFRIERRTVTK